LHYPAAFFGQTSLPAAYSAPAVVAGAVFGSQATAGGEAGLSTATASRPDSAAASGGIEYATVRFRGEDVELSGVLVRSAASATAARRPAIVLLHGCGGMFDSRGRVNARTRDWSERFASWGMVVLAVDSFSPRGAGSICELKERPAHPWAVRAADAYAALGYLVSRQDVDAANVFVIGWSHGGSTVTGVVRADSPGRRAEGPHFKAAIAFYPGCERALRYKSYRPTIPLLMLHGEADDWAPVGPCLQLRQKAVIQNWPVQLITYPDAHHGFDAPNVSVRSLPNV
jgi:dienelactone hydrolase